MENELELNELELTVAMAVFAMAFIAAGTAQAHHSFAMFDQGSSARSQILKLAIRGTCGVSSRIL
jgi:hypothetical protein